MSGIVRVCAATPSLPLSLSLSRNPLARPLSAFFSDAANVANPKKGSHRALKPCLQNSTFFGKNPADILPVLQLHDRGSEKSNTRFCYTQPKGQY
jgi:hypothetical protein